MRIETILVILLLFVLPVFAVECPPGFEWQRMSGVGCVQKDCVSKGGSYGYTQNCFCREDKSCYEAVNYSQFDGNNCKPFCPYSRLIGCVEPGEKCSNEKPTQQSCDTYCKGYHGPHATAKVVNDSCDCGCEEGYAPDQTLLCRPTKATCDKYCKEYHGGDMLRGEYAYGTVRGISCDCHCNKGYIPDNTLTCVKAKNCSEECVKRMGEGGIGTGTYPNCNCDCKKGYTKHNVYDKEQKTICEKIKCPGNSTFNEQENKCICKAGFWSEPINGVCVPLNRSKTCGDKTCDSDVLRMSKQGDVPENCENCPEDCGCSSGEVCNIRHPLRLGELQTSMQDPTLVKGCVSEAARIIDIGCADGGGVPKVNIHRAGTVREQEFEAQVGMSLSVLDQVTLTKFTDKGMCNEPYVTLEWGNVRGTMFLGPPILMHTLTIQHDAVQSGWPDQATQGVKAGVSFAIKTGIKQIIKRTVQVLGAPARILLSPDKTSGDTVKVYVKSEILIQQNQSGTTIYTLEGEPIIEYKGRNVTVHNGSKVTIDSKGMSNVTAFNPAEPGDWYLRIPDPPDNFGESSPGDIAMPDLDLEGAISDIGNIASDIKNQCCGSIAMVLAVLVLAAWSERKEQDY